MLVWYYQMQIYKYLICNTTIILYNILLHCQIKYTPHAMYIISHVFFLEKNYFTIKLKLKNQFYFYTFENYNFINERSFLCAVLIFYF